MTSVHVAVLSTSFNLTATAAAPTAITLAWEDNSAHEAGFEIHRSTTGATGTFDPYVTLGANATTFTDWGATPSTLYCYRVRAFREVAGGRKTTYGGFSSVACAKTPLRPPSNVNAIPASSSEIRISWTDNGPADDSFRIERSATSAGPWEPVATTSPSETAYTDANRTGDQQVCYRVIAVSAEDGDSGPSNIDCTASPLAPSNFVATPDAWGIQLTWIDNSDVEDGYWVERSTDGVSFGVLASAGPNASNFYDAYTSSNTPYWYRLRATKDGGYSDMSTASAVRTCTPTTSYEDSCEDGVDNDCDDMIDGGDPDCPEPTCDWFICGPGYTYSCYDGMCYPHCDNGYQDGDESDVDCGGSCGPCEQPPGGGL